MSLRRSVLGILLSVVMVSLSAQDAAPEQAEAPIWPALGYGLGGIDFWGLELYAALGPFNLVNDAPSRVMAYLGGGYLNDAYYRNPAGNLVADPWDLENGRFKKIQAGTKLGLELGLLYDEAAEKNSLYSRLFMLSRWQLPVFDPDQPALLETSGLPDAGGSWQTSLFMGLYWDQLDFRPRFQSYRGYALELSLEWVPGLAFNRFFGEADYLRVNAVGSVHWPLLSLSWLELYVSNRSMADALFGDTIPGNARRSVGGFKPSAATGGMVRGMESAYHDTYLKLLNNLELRAPFLPLLDSRLVPEFFAFLDLARVDDLDYSLFRNGSFLLSSGAGLFLNIKLGGFKFDLGYYLSYSFTDSRWQFLNLAIGGHHF